MRNIGKGLGSVLLGSVALATWTSARSEQAPATSDSLEEIMVTAQRRPQKLQDVPISMSAITGTTLENLGAKSLTDYAALIPNLAVGTGSGAGGAGSSFGASSTRAIAIRGVAGNNTTALYLNDTAIPLSVDPRALDIDHIEVLRGPQGTLFGAGSMGGTVRLVTREPSTTESSGQAKAEGTHTNHGGGGYSVDGTANIPIVSGVVGLRLNAFSAFEPGLYTRTWGGAQDPRSPSLPYPPGPVSTGQKAHVGATQSTGVSAALTVTPTSVPGLTISPTLMYQRSASNGYPLADYSADQFVQGRQFNIPEAVEDTWTFAGVTAKLEESYGQFIASGTYFYRNAYDYEDTTDVNSILFWGLPYYVPSALPNNLITKTWTGEARFESTLPGPVQFVLGAFDSLQKRSYIQNWNVPGLNAASGGTIGSDLEFTQNSPNADRQRAAFIDISYKVTKNLDVTGGIRTAFLAHEGTYVADGPFNGGPSSIFTEHSERQTAPRFTAKYQYAAGQNVYASVAKGFRIGGTNSPLPPVCQSSLADRGIPNGAPFKSDSLWSYEVGAKNTWASERVRSRLAVYRLNWKDIQQSFILPCTWGITTNSGAAVSKGVEMELDLAAIKHLTLNLTAGYEDASITEANSQSNTFVGQALAGVPKWTGSVVAQYSLPLFGRNGYIRGDWSYTGARVSYNNIAPPTGRAFSAYRIVNARAGVAQGPWDFALFVDNMFDVRGVVGDLIGEGGELPGRPRLFVVRPFTVGVQIKRSF